MNSTQHYINSSTTPMSMTDAVDINDASYITFLHRGMSNVSYVFTFVFHCALINFIQIRLNELTRMKNKTKTRHCVSK